jgi:hypothetical protein
VPPGTAIVINDLGLFFNPSLLKEEAGYTGGGSQAQLMILLRELSHLTKWPLAGTTTIMEIKQRLMLTTGI